MYVVCLLIARALGATTHRVHALVVAQDIKPANLLLTAPTHLAIADFDVATQVVRLRSQHLSCVGTPWYTAPEVIMVEPYSTAADIWSIGCCAVHLATGKRPYSECNHVQAAYVVSRQSGVLRLCCVRVADRRLAL